EKNRSLAASEDSSDEPDLCRGAGGHGNLSVADCRCAHGRKGLDGHIGADDRGLHVAHLSPGDSYQNPLRALPDCGHDHFHGGRGSLHDPGEFCPAAHGDFPYNILEIGFFLEILCFSMGLGYKMWQTNKDRQRIQEAYIRELKRNEAIIQEANLQLEQKVKERTSEVIRKNKEIEDERKKQMAGDYERRLAIAEMSALRAQMNPHFMFESSHTLETFMLKKQKETASRFLNAVSRLLRLVQEHSRLVLGSVEKEVEALELYHQPEEIRYDNRVS